MDVRGGGKKSYAFLDRNRGIEWRIRALHPFRRVEHVPYGVYLNGAIRAENQIIFDQRGVTKNPVDRRIWSKTWQRDRGVDTVIRFSPLRLTKTAFLELSKKTETELRNDEFCN